MAVLLGALLVLAVPAAALELTGTKGPDDLVGSDESDVLRGRGGDGKLRGEGGNDTLHGGDGWDRLHGGRGKDKLYAGASNDDLPWPIRGFNHNEVHGGRGADELHGGKGVDDLYGGEGDDLFVFQPGNGADMIMDFTPGEDLIDLAAFGGIAGFADMRVTNDRHASCTGQGRVWCIDLMHMAAASSRCRTWICTMTSWSLRISC